MQAERNTSGLQAPWQPGQSGYRAGAMKVPRAALTFARKHCLEAFETALAVMRDPETPPPTRLTAALALIDRALGKPKEHVQVDGGIGLLRVEFVDLNEPQRHNGKGSGHIIDVPFDGENS